MTSIAIVGPGAIGGTVAAHLSEAHGGSVSIAARTPFDVLEVECPDRVLRSTPPILTDPARAQPVDWVLVAVKAYDTDAAAPWLRSLVGPRSTVAILQNGVESVERFAAHVPAEQLLPVVVDLPAHRSAPGRIVQAGTAELTVPASAGGARFAELFAGTGVHAHTTEDFVTASWRKLALNAAGAITAATLVPRLDMSRPATARLARRTVEEAVAVGRAEGAALPDRVIDEILSALSTSTSNLPNSMHADRLAGRPMEIDARNGAVVRIGRRHGVAVPVNTFLVELLRVAASGAGDLDGA